MIISRRNIVIAAVLVIGGLFLMNSVFNSSGAEQPAGPVEITTLPAQTPDATTKPSAKPTPNKSPTEIAEPLTPDQLASPGAIILLNPATGTRGSNIGVSGVGFDAGATVDIYLQVREGAQLESLGFAQVDKGGGFGGFSFRIPEDLTSDTFTIVAQQHDGKFKASAKGRITGSSVSVKLGTQVGKAGDTTTVSGKGFAPNENVFVYFNSLAADPIATLKADGSGGLGRMSIKVPFGPSGDNSFIFVGEDSQSPVTVQFFMLTFYPTAGISEYAAKADTLISFSGNDFGPGERVLVYLNSPSSTPIAVIQTDDQGSFTSTGGFVIPFELTGKNLLIFIGEETQSAVTTSFDVLPYTPFAEPSTYGGQPGTSLTFYGAGFARNEIVRVYIGRTRDNPGKQVACAKTDDKGALAGGSVTYTIPANAQSGKLSFGLVGDKSKGEATATIQVMPPSGPVQPDTSSGDQGAFVCSFDVEDTEEDTQEGSAE
ncbi:MAG: hypothetical protein HYY30_14350 [Chloroflexi bacterium]|nr:hypothetical protein [Chloroflexota bacterium]